MMWKIIFMIFGLSQVCLMDSINQCADHYKEVNMIIIVNLGVNHQIKLFNLSYFLTMKCNPNIDLPCCEENNKCTLMHWNDRNLYKCLKTSIYLIL